MSYLHLQSHIITLFHILTGVHWTGVLPLIHEIVPENITLLLTAPIALQPSYGMSLPLSSTVRWPAPRKSSCSAVGYLILSRLCSTGQAMTNLLTTWGSCCSGLWKIVKRDVSIPKAFSTTVLPRLILYLKTISFKSILRLE